MPFPELSLKQFKNEITTILINETMRKKQAEKNYSAPVCTMIQVNEVTNLMAGTTFNGQHNPATPGGTISSAKQAPSWLSEDEDEEENHSWGD